MLQPDPTAPARDDAPAVGGPEGDLVQKDENGTENPIAFARQHAVAEPPAQESPCSDETLLREAQPQSDTARLEAALPDGARPGGEIELKLLVADDRLADFNAAPIIATNARNKGTRKHLKSVYYDTPERALRRNGLSLRVRQSGARFVQSVKAEFEDYPLRRGQWEANVPSIDPDVGLAIPFIPANLRSDFERHQLEAVFTADIHRRTRIIELPSGTVEIAFDHGFLKSGSRSMPVGEIGLELKDAALVRSTSSRFGSRSMGH